MRLIRYAGFDPDENNFAISPPLSRKAIDTDRARVLRSRGLTWDQVGIELAHEHGRPASYRDTSIINALRRGAS
jgi:hypothetical protein